MLLLPFHTLPLQASSQHQSCHLGGERRRLENIYAKPTARAAPWHTWNTERTRGSWFVHTKCVACNPLVNQFDHVLQIFRMSQGLLTGFDVKKSLNYT